MLAETQIIFQTLDDVNRFMNMIQHIESKMTLSNGEREIDGQSVLSVMSLGFRHPILVSYPKADSKAVQLLEEFAI